MALVTSSQAARITSSHVLGVGQGHMAEAPGGEGASGLHGIGRLSGQPPPGDPLGRAHDQVEPACSGELELGPGLRPRTVDLYRWLLAKYIAPHLGEVQLGKLSAHMIRKWRAELLRAGVSQTQTAKAYRLLRAVLMTAVDEDHILSRNPCRVKGAGTEQAPERPVLTVAQVYRPRRTRRPVTGWERPQARLRGPSPPLPQGRPDAAPQGDDADSRCGDARAVGAGRERRSRRHP